MGNQFCDPSSASYPKWSVFDALMWKLAPERIGGGRPRLEEFKDAWIVYNKARIRSEAKAAAIPVDLLGCVAYNEVGGDPPFVKRDVVLPVRQFDWSGPDWASNNLTITKPPGSTSEGAVKIQLRVAARQMNVDGDHLTFQQQNALTACLETDAFNLNVVARLLRDLIKHDFPSATTDVLTEEQFIIAGSRYNRGDARALQDFIDSLSDPAGSPRRSYTEYGRAMVRHRAHVMQLLLP